MKMKKAKLKMAGSGFLILAVLFFLTLLSCEEDAFQKEPPIPTVGFITSSYTVSDTIGDYTFLEIEASQYVEAYQYEVYFKFDGTAVLDTDFSWKHGEYETLDGDIYYKAWMSKGIRKCAIAVLPVDNSTGDKTLNVTLYADQEGDRYTLKSGMNSASLTIQDN
jgi:hypothetical protein